LIWAIKLTPFFNKKEEEDVNRFITVKILLACKSLDDFGISAYKAFTASSNYINIKK
jgi:hypothetical protein